MPDLLLRSMFTWVITFGIAMSGHAASQTVLEEIVVTATKQEESLRDVPVSATAFTAEDMREAFVVDSVDLVRMIPNAIIAYGGGPDYLNNIIMRGQGGGRSGQSETATGIYRNGVYIAGSTFGGNQLMRLDLFDVERIEAFRGPQGALYGRNAVGGAVNAVTAKPDLAERSFSTKLGYDEVEKFIVEGVANVPVSDAFGIRVSGYYHDQQDGFYENTTTGEQLDAQNYWGARIGFRLAPEDASYDATLWVESMAEEAPSFSAYSFRPDPPFNNDPFLRPFNGTSEADIEQDSAFFEGSWAIGEQLLSISAVYMNRDGSRIDDLDWYLGIADGAAGLVATQQAETERRGIEGRFESANDQRFRWMLGAEVFRFSEDRDTQNLGYAGANQTLAADETDSWSLFGRVATDLSPTIELTGELRYSVDDKSNVTTQTSLVTGDSLRDFSASRKFSNVQPAVSLSWAAADWANLYAKVATAYRAGGFNDQPPAGVSGGDTYDEEKSISFEVGAKTRLLDGQLQLDAALYVLETKDIQIVSRGPQPPNPTYLQNGGDARNYGLEVDMRALWPIESTGGYFTTGVGFSVAHGEYTNGSYLFLDSGDLITIELDGRELSRLRDFTANVNISYAQPILDNGTEVFVRGLYQTERGGFEDAANNDALPDFDILDLRTGIRGDRWQFSVYAKNITEEEYIVEQLTTGQQFLNRPRVVGAEVQFDL